MKSTVLQKVWLVFAAIGIGASLFNFKRNY